MTAGQGDDFDVVLKPGQTANLFSNLSTEFPGRAKYQRLSTEVALVKVQQQAYSKSGGFTATGFGFGDQVFAF